MTITLYTAGTANGYKISIALELLKLSYKVVPLSIAKDETHTESFLKINPVGKIPAITDSAGPKKKDGSDFAVFESGAILLYLTDKYDKDRKISYAPTSPYYYDQLEWLFFQTAGLGPIQGQLNHFYKFAPEKIEYGIKRYATEARKYYDTLNKQIENNGNGFVVGDHLSIVDIALVGWVAGSSFAGIEVEEEFPAVHKWLKRVAANEDIYKGFSVPTSYAHIEKYR